MPTSLDEAPGLLRVARPCARLLFVVASAMLLGGCSGLANRSPSQSTPSSAQPTPSAAWVTFTSDRHAYSIGHPADWRVVEQPGSVFLPRMKIGSSGTDTIGSRDALRYNSDDGVVTVFAVELEGAESLADFTDRVSQEAACGRGGYGRRATQLDGEPAEFSKFSCGDYDWIQVTAIHGGLGYVVWCAATVEPPAEERPINDQFLATFRFTN